MPHNSEFRFKDFTRGFFTPVRALQLIFNQPRLFGLCIFPIFLTLIVAAVGIYAVLTGAWYLGHAWLQNIAGNYAGVASGLFAFFVGLFTLYLLFHSIGILLSLIDSPFNDWLAEETERACGQHPRPLNFSVFVRVFFLDLRKTILTLLLSITFWFLALVPGLALISGVGFALITTLTFISYPQSRRQLGVFECLVWMKNHFFASFGFGCSTMILFGFPVLNAFALPLSVVGGTLLFLDYENTNGENAK